MKKLAVYYVLAILISSCSAQATLYTWNNYETASYNFLKNRDEKSTQELIYAYYNLIQHQNGSRSVVPPGIYADYGFLLIQSGRVEEGRKLLEKEMSLYPEAKIFINRILNSIENE